jgi:hypothetical protein
VGDGPGVRADAPVACGSDESAGGALEIDAEVDAGDDSRARTWRQDQRGAATFDLSLSAYDPGDRGLATASITSCRCGYEAPPRPHPRADDGPSSSQRFLRPLRAAAPRERSGYRPAHGLRLSRRGHLVPLGATGPKPIVVATHGLWNPPEGLCDDQRWIFHDRAWVICPRGRPLAAAAKVDRAARGCAGGQDAAGRLSSARRPFGYAMGLDVNRIPTVVCDQDVP